MMNQQSKTRLTKLYSILLILLAAALTVVSVMPVVTFKTADTVFPMEYYTGSFTVTMDTPEDIGLGLKAIVDVVRHFTDMQSLISSQAGNKLLDEEERDRLAHKLDEDESFANSVLLFYAFGGLMEEEDSSDDLDTGALGTGKLRVAKNILGVILILSLIGTGLVFPIIIAIKFIAFLTRSLKHLKDDTAEDVDTRMDKFVFTSYTATMLMFYMLYALVAKGVGMGMAIRSAILIFLAVCLLRAIKTMLFTDKKDWVAMLIKQAITVVSIVALATLLVNFIGVGLINELDDVVVDMSQKQYLAELDELWATDTDDYKLIKFAQKAVSTSNGVNTAIFVTLGLTGALIMLAGLGNAVERFSNRKGKTKTGKLIEYKAMIVLAVILLVIGLTPMLVATTSAEARDEAYENGTFKIWYTEYQTEGTLLNLRYELLNEFKEAAEEELAELYEERKSASEEKLEEIEDEIEIGEEMLGEANAQIAKIEARAKRPVNCLLAAIAFLLAECAYLLVPKYFLKKTGEPVTE